VVDELIRLLALGGSGGAALGATYLIVTSIRPILEKWLEHRARVIEAREAASLPLAERLLLQALERADFLEAEVASLRKELDLVRHRCAGCSARTPTTGTPIVRR
jgi:hypothetical protein